MKNIKSILIGAALTFTANVAMADQIGLVGLYKNGTGLNEVSVAALGCSVAREGSIVAAQGKLSPDLPQPDQFVLLACDQPVMTSSDRRAAVSALFTDGDVIAAFEGALADFQLGNDTSGISQRQYILKLGYYNNADVDGREADLAALDTLASAREGRWTTEAFLAVHSSVGIPTPDEAVLLHYETAEIAEKFRQDNADLLVEVGTFNDAHLTAFTYLVGAATR